MIKLVTDASNENQIARWHVWVCSFLLLALGVGIAAAEITIPKQSNWTDHGTIAQPGGDGEWDRRLLGGFSPSAVIKKNGTYFVYYIGASGGRSNDNGPAFRALGVLTSSDGVNFTKYAGNPVITHWEPPGHENAQEAGVFTTGALLDNGDVLMYVGAMTAISSDGVNDDGKLYISSDGFNFTLVGTVLDHADPLIWGSGDEIDPFGVFQHPTNGSWHMYYSAAAGWNLAHISGPSRDDFTNTTSGPVLTSDADVVGGCDPIFIGPEEIVLFVDRADGWSDWFTEARTAHIDSPKDLSAPVETYDFSGTMGTAIFLDQEAGKWFMFYNKGTEQHTNNPGEGTTIGLRTAPVNGVEAQSVFSDGFESGNTTAWSSSVPN